MDPIDPRVKDKMLVTIGALKEWFEPFGVTLLVFDYGNLGRMNYASTANREDMLASMKEFIAKHEGRYVKVEKNKKEKEN